MTFTIRKVLPPVLAIHGGGWSTQDKASWRGVAEFLAEQGCCVYNINYRLCGTAPWPACGDDCLDAARFLLEKHARIFLGGGSAGGHLALMTGLRGGCFYYCELFSKNLSL